MDVVLFFALKFVGTTERSNKFGTFTRSQGVLGDDSSVVSLTRNRQHPSRRIFVRLCPVHTGGRERNRDVRDGGAYCGIHAWGFFFHGRSDEVKKVLFLSHFGESIDGNNLVAREGSLKRTGEIR
jgi:hypothetical protein